MHIHTLRDFLNSIPKLYEDRDRLDYIPGMVPNMFELPEGCYFAPRCKYCQEICRHEKPQMQEVGPGHMAACHFPTVKEKRTGGSVNGNI